ncbi:MAG: tripartite tricarboxylate transporter substrate-binding protein, partial [Deltaproteobacteria bacterium]
MLRVTASARRIATCEGADVPTVACAALLHELFNYPKSHPESHRSGDVCAEHAAALLDALGYPEEDIAPVAYAIRVHGFSRGIVPDTLEGRVLQDADRLDAIGAIGIVENMPGASGNIAVSSMLRQPADGYAIFLGTSAALAVNPHLYKEKSPYDPQKDLAPVILATKQASQVLVH